MQTDFLKSFANDEAKYIAPVAALYDPVRQQAVLTSQRGLHRGFFLVDETELYSSQVSGGLLVSDPVFSRVNTDDLVAALPKFEVQFDLDEYKRLRDDRGQISLSVLAPVGFFLGMGYSSGPEQAPPVFKGAGVERDGLLRLDFWSGALKMNASFWVDFKARRVVRAVVGGHEMKPAEIKRKVIFGAVMESSPHGVAVDGADLRSTEIKTWIERNGEWPGYHLPPGSTFPSPVTEN